MKQKRISKVGERWKKILADSEKKLKEIQEKSEEDIFTTARPKAKRTYNKRNYKKKSVSVENNSDVGDIGVDIDERLSSENNFESEV